MQFFAGVLPNPPTSNGEIYIFWGDGTRVSIVLVGDISISFGRDRILVLKDSLYVPSIRRNLISISRLVDNGYSVYFSNSVVIKLNKYFICSGTLVDGLYVINHISHTQQLNELNNTNALPCKRKQPSELNQTYLWHLRLGHINLR